jgi:hypothetical protein
MPFFVFFFLSLFARFQTDVRWHIAARVALGGLL